MFVFALTFVMSVLCGDQAWSDALRLTADASPAGAWWVPLSAPFTLPESILVYGFVHLLVQWFIGGRLERFWGTRRYLIFTLCTAVLGFVGAWLALAFTPLGAQLGRAALGGPVAIDLAAVLAFGVVFGKERHDLPGLQTPLSGWAIAGFTALLAAALVPFGGGSPLDLLPAAGALLTATAFVLQPWRPRPKSGKLGAARRAPHLRVVHSADDLLN